MNTTNNGEKMPEVFNYQPIGIFRSDKSSNYDVPRQSGIYEHASNKEDYIELFKGHQFEQALENLNGFSRIWVIFEFHKNKNWNPKVMPPRGSHVKLGVFSTRSPYRPNPLGLSCVEILRIEGLKIFISSSDLLNDTPIFDIKPYIPEYDSFPQEKIGWLESLKQQKYQLSFSSIAKEKIDYLLKIHKIDLLAFIQRSLEFEPMNKETKRLIFTNQTSMLCYRTWRILFKVQEDTKLVEIFDIISGYSTEELYNSKDPYQDKSIHQIFSSNFKP